MKNFIQQHGTYLLAFGGALIIILCLLRTCNTPQPITPISDTTAIVTEYKVKEAEKNLNNLTIRDTIRVKEYKYIKGKVDTIIRNIYLSAPDTCKSYIDKVDSLGKVKLLNAESVIAGKDSIINTQDSLIKFNEILMRKCKQDNVALRDTIPKVKRKAFWNGVLKTANAALVLIGGVVIINSVK